MAHILKSFAIAFSMYSRIPMPQFEWDKEDMKYALCFFPWVGGVIGLLLFGWWKLCAVWEIGTMAWAFCAAAIPLLVTGGFHADGFFDTMDAFHSYQPRERKLEILKDSHIGAFAVICFFAYALIGLAALSEIKSQEAVLLLGAACFLSRALSGLGVVLFPCAKQEGLLYRFSDGAKKNTVTAALLIQIVVCAAFMLYQSVEMGLLTLAVAGAAFVYYRLRCGKEFGGITGDTAGYFVTVCEGAAAVILAVCEHI